jgi:hypothetical protein
LVTKHSNNALVCGCDSSTSQSARHSSGEPSSSPMHSLTHTHVVSSSQSSQAVEHCSWAHNQQGRSPESLSEAVTGRLVPVTVRPVVGSEVV